MPALPPPILFNPSQHTHLIPSIASIHIACILQDHQVLSFIPPFTSGPKTGDPDPRVVDYWHVRATQVAAGSRFIVLQMAPGEQPGDEEQLAGCVSLDHTTVETGPFRAEIEKLLVDPRFRRRGVARALMVKLEEVARERGATLLKLDTKAGSPAEQAYGQLGYVEFGILPKSGIDPQTGELIDEVFFYKQL